MTTSKKEIYNNEFFNQHDSVNPIYKLPSLRSGQLKVYISVILS